MSDKYFVNCPIDGFSTYETEQQAIDSANESLSCLREGSSEGWSEEVDQIYWGVIKQDAYKLIKDGFADYELKNIN